MTENKQVIEEKQPGTHTNSPAVGLRIKPDSNTHSVIGAIYRANQHSHDVLLVADDDADRDIRSFADEMDASVIEPDPSHSTNGASIQERIATVAKSRGYPGLIWQPNPAVDVDFERSSEKLRETDAYWTVAEQSPTVATRQTVLAAIPAYNEAQRIGDVVAGARKHADEVLVVDDGSSDETVANARSAGATVIEHDTNRGYGTALKTIFREAHRCGVEHLVILDGDGQHDAGDIPKLVRAQQERNAEVVIGSRFDGETDLPLYRRCGLAVVNLFTNLSMGVVRPSSRIRDTQSGFRAYDRRAIRTLAEDDSIGDKMEASTDILHHAHINDYRIEEVGTTISYDVEDANSQSPFSHGFMLMKNILRTIEMERPLTIIGIPGFVMAFAGLGVGYAALVHYIQTLTFPIALVAISISFSLLGLLASFTAIILHALNQHKSLSTPAS